MSEPTNNGRWAAVYEAMTGATAPGQHHEGPTGTNTESVKAGHEPDRFDARGIIAVPFLVVAVTACAYFLVTALFSYLEPGAPTAASNAAAAADNAKSFNERIAAISSSDPNAKFAQPRLEYLKSIDNKRPTASKPDPVFLRSFEASKSNNTYELTPQDLYPGKFTDPITGKKLLDEFEWVAKDKNVARIPVNTAIQLLAGRLKSKPGSAPLGTNGTPTQANGGQAIAPPSMPATAPKDEPKH
jgi:hypothetical protein